MTDSTMITITRGSCLTSLDDEEVKTLNALQAVKVERTNVLSLLL